MITSAKVGIRTLLLCVLFLASNAFATDCYEKSPNFANQEDEYYNFENPITLSNDEQNQVNSLFKQLRGKWKGKGIHIECLGPDNAPEERKNNTKIKTKAESGGSLSLSFNSEIKNLDNSVTHNERTDLLGNNPIFSFESRGSHHIVFAEKYRSSNTTRNHDNKRFSRLVENVYEIKLNNGQLHLIKLYYINGIYVAKDEWNLSRGI